MIDELLFTLTLIAALGCGLVAGIFFAFSTFVMKALARVPSAEGIAAMQSINITVINPWFMGAFFGTASACVLVVVISLFRWNEAEAVYLVSGGLAYLIGTILVTIVFNVPRNNALAAVDPQSADGARVWAGYVTGWTAWNHVRTVAAGEASTTTQTEEDLHRIQQPERTGEGLDGTPEHPRHSPGQRPPIEQTADEQEAAARLFEK